MIFKHELWIVFSTVSTKLFTMGRERWKTLRVANSGVMGTWDVIKNIWWKDLFPTGIFLTKYNKFDISANLHDNQAFLIVPLKNNDLLIKASGTV